VLKNNIEVITSILTIVFALLAIAVFIGYGAGVAFYLLFVIALAVGLYNTWIISKEQQTPKRAARVRAKAPAGRRRRPRRR
jgi:4-hydroxybenzoate polyprenyltransferase